MLTLITTPAVLPVSLAEVKALARLQEDEDAVVAGLTRTAVEWVEQRLGRALVTQVWEYTIDAFPCGYRPAIHIPLGPIQSIDEVRYLDTSGTQQTLAAPSYLLADGWLWPAYGITWPTTRAQAGGVVVRATVGYGDSWNDVPEPIRAAIAESVRGLYDGCKPSQVDELLQPYRVWAY